MNKDRRKAIATLGVHITTITGLLTELRSNIEAIKDDEQEAFDNLSDGAKEGDRGQAMEAALSAFDTALEAVDAIDTENIVTALSEAGDISVDAETRKAAITEDERLRRQWDRLPKWARDRMAQADDQIEMFKKDKAAAYADPTGKAGELVISDYSDLDGKVLPFKRVSFLGETGDANDAVQVVWDEDRKMVEVRCPWGMLSIMPSSGNAVYVKGGSRI